MCMNKCIEVLAYSQIVVTTKINTGPLIQTCKAHHMCVYSYIDSYSYTHPHNFTHA